MTWIDTPRGVGHGYIPDRWLSCSARRVSSETAGIFRKQEKKEKLTHTHDVVLGLAGWTVSVLGGLLRVSEA